MENKEIAVTQQGPIVNYSQEQVELIKKTIAIGATDLELKMFLAQCARTGLDAITRQIYFIKSNGKVQIQTSIDGFRVIAERSGAYEGQTKPEWCGDDGKWVDVWLSADLPRAARVGVYKKGFREALYGVALFDEYAQRINGKLSFMWDKMPALMISKVAESLALRKAFPNEMGGLYTEDEMGQSKNDSDDSKNETQEPPPVVLMNQPKKEDQGYKPKLTPSKAKPIVANEPPDERTDVGFALNKERMRLLWSPADLTKFAVTSFQKAPIEMTTDEMKLMLKALQKMAP